MGTNDEAAALNPSIRASDADRERVVEMLRQNNVEGRLTSEEFDERMSAAYSAKTLGALAELTTDLPVDLAAHTRRQAELARAKRAEAAGTVALRKQLKAAFAGWLSLAVVLNVVWVISGMHGYWPAWPLGAIAAITAGRFIRAWGER